MKRSNVMGNKKKRLLLSALAVTAAAGTITAGGAWMRPSGGMLPAQAKQQEKDGTQALKPVAQFGHKLFAQHLKETNPAVSPVSAYLTLCMVGSGAKGTTKKEFQNVLGKDMLSAPAAFDKVAGQEGDGVQLTVANSAWLDDAFTVNKKWLSTAKNLFGADVYEEDLGTEATKDKINQWASKRTNKKITKLLSKKLDKQARLALVNALYFHAKWQQEFIADSTHESDFHLDGGATETVDMMNGNIHNCGYFKDDASEGVVLPYKDSNFAFVAIKPLSGSTIRDWYQSYSPQGLAGLVAGRKTQEVELSIPKFTIRCKLDLKDSLKSIGIKKAFDEKKADLTLLGKSADDGNLYVSMIKQEAVISVAEKGTEAAAATFAGIAAGTAFMPDKPVVRFDRPFLYMIMDMESGVPLFMGIVDQP